MQAVLKSVRASRDMLACHSTSHDDSMTMCISNLERRKMWVRPFVSTFHTQNDFILVKSDEQCLQKALPTHFSMFQNRLGTINFESQDDDSMTMCLSNSTSSHKMMIA